MPARILERWADVPQGLRPFAPHTGPFPTGAFLETWQQHRLESDAQTPIAADASGSLPLWIDRGTIRFQGEADLTDYHSPLGASLDDAATLMAAEFRGRTFSFDSLPPEAAEPLFRALTGTGAATRRRRTGSTLVLDLPADEATWLASLPKKHRHEIRRKRRRFATMVGSPQFERRSDREALDLFISMHRAASGGKGAFMTGRMAAFFDALITTAGATIDVLTVRDRPVATAFGFPTPDAYYLYNSAYAPDAAGAAPGIVLVAAMVERAIARDVARFDFLKGDERYKLHLGAVERPLFTLEGVFE